MAEKKKYSDIDLSKYESGYQASDEVNLASKLKNDAESAVKNYGSFQYGNQDAYNKAMDAILNRKQFSYDLNGDALYQQYKDNYITQGKQAMMDTMGQAVAMTGGYGNSYAATVGNQTYQGYLQGINDKVPELYQLALDRYNSEGDRLATNYNLLATDRANTLSEHESGYNKLIADRDYYANNYDTAYSRDYSVWDSNRTYDTKQYWDETNFGLESDEYELSKRSVEAQETANKLAKEQSENMVDYSQITKFQNSLVDEDKLEKVTIGSRGNTGNGGYKYGGKRYANYKDYVKAQLDDHYSKFGTINAGTLAYLLDFYGIE